MTNLFAEYLQNKPAGHYLKRHQNFHQFAYPNPVVHLHGQNP